ncbi:MAG: HzsA-related protein [Pirellulales bacterium]
MNARALTALMFLPLAGLAAGAAPPAAPTTATEIVRRDWYFRETLPAIRDWEAILARLERETPEEKRTPVFPVPANGDVVRWPNPIPVLLLPEEDRQREVRLRVAGGRVAVDRTPPVGKDERRTFKPGETVLGYKHPGGGAKDQWYHAYFRRFDGFTQFQPKPAPLALELDAPFDFRQGANALAVKLRNTSDKPLALSVRLRVLSARPAASDQDAAPGRRELALAPGAGQSVEFSFDLAEPGGRILLLSIGGAGEDFWVPLFAHVEDLPAVETSIEQILADAPDAAAARQLAELRGAAATTHRARFERASALRDELLLRRIAFDRLLFVRRQPYISEQPYMDAHHLYNRPGGAIYCLSPARPGGNVTPVVDSLGEGVYRDYCLHWDAKKLIFSFGNGSDNWDGKPSYHLYEVGIDGRGLKQLTFGVKNDCEPFYLPNGQIGFTSDRSEHFVMCGGPRHVANLFVMNADGSGIRQLSFNLFNDFNPTVLPDGRILYTRWEYNERSVTSLHDLFTMHPDGTKVAPYYGNATIRPNVIMFPRAVPGDGRVMALFTAHHGQTHGPIGLVDINRGLDGPGPITLLTPGIPVTGEKAEDSSRGWFSDPVPLSDSTYLCSYTPTVVPWLAESWAIYVGDRHGNLALVFRDPRISCAEPLPLVPRPRPDALPPAADESGRDGAEATLLLVDVYRGLSGVPRGAAKHLRIIEDVPRKSVPEGGVILTAGTSIYTVKRIFGTVPIEPDGSAHFKVPANRNVYFEVLDENRREIQRMRSVVCLKPDDRVTCVGCHEARTTAPPNVAAAAFRRAPSQPAPPPWGKAIFSFLRDVQPVLDAKCVSCHAHDRPANRVILTGDLTDQFSIGYEELLPYLTVANSMRWDQPEDVERRPPYTYGSKVSRLTKLLEAGHYGVQLTAEEWDRVTTWIDANGAYYDRYESAYGDNRHLFTRAIQKPLDEVYSRRCASCHGDQNEAQKSTFCLSLNRDNVRASRALAAPLAKSAGGWGRCRGTVFAGTDDPDYKAILAALGALEEMLAEKPREDVLSLRDPRQ